MYIKLFLYSISLFFFDFFTFHLSYFFLFSLISKCFIPGNYSFFFFFSSNLETFVLHSSWLNTVDEATCAQHRDIDIRYVAHSNQFGSFFMQCLLCMLRWKKEGAGEEIAIFYVSLSFVFSRQFLKNSMFRCDKSQS